MALRSAARHLRPLLGPAGARFAQSAPTVFDKMVQFYVIDKSGARHTVRGLEGVTLAATLREYGARPPRRRRARAHGSAIGRRGPPRPVRVAAPVAPRPCGVQPGHAALKIPVATGAFPDDYFMPHPTEPACIDCHVYVGQDYVDKLPPLDGEQSDEQRRLVGDYVSARRVPQEAGSPAAAAACVCVCVRSCVHVTSRDHTTSSAAGTPSCPHPLSHALPTQPLPHATAPQVRANARPNSRMAYYIKLAPQLNGMTVALGPIEPWLTE
jgi:hypothetical protein